jgi:hypothetical protein
MHLKLPQSGVLFFRTAITGKRAFVTLTNTHVLLPRTRTGTTALCSPSLHLHLPWIQIFLSTEFDYYENRSGPVDFFCSSKIGQLQFKTFKS